ncbi:putative quinol monooxygenase [Murinocardiopsis flavida]|nr:hypothetical protein [Murinocardiopsis flavida]
MVEVGLAFVCALVAWSATAALTARCYRSPQLSMWAWVASVVGVTVALSAAFPGALLGFSAATFRIFQIGVALLGPVLIAWGAVEYAVRSARARFGTRLVVTTLTIVPLVVFSLDRLRGSFTSGYPAFGDHYDILPRFGAGLVHAFVAIALAACAIVVARRMRDAPRTSRHELMVLGLVAAAALLEILVARFGMGVLGQIAVVGALGCMWAAFMQATNPPQERRSRRSGGRRARGGHGADPETDFDEPDDEEDDVRRKRRRAAEYDDYDAYDEAPAPGGGAARMSSVITIYTLSEGRADLFDECADDIVREVGRYEPDTLLFACHTVPSAPSQRIVYAIYRDELAYNEHQQQPHVLEFGRRSAPAVAATNVIELAVSGAAATETLAGMLLPR